MSSNIQSDVFNALVSCVVLIAVVEVSISFTVFVIT